MDYPYYYSKWQSVALENYLERAKLEIFNIIFSSAKKNLSAKQRQTLKALSTNSEVNLKKADKGTNEKF